MNLTREQMETAIVENVHDWSFDSLIDYVINDMQDSLRDLDDSEVYELLRRVLSGGEDG